MAFLSKLVPLMTTRAARLVRLVRERARSCPNKPLAMHQLTILL